MSLLRPMSPRRRSTFYAWRREKTPGHAARRARPVRVAQQGGGVRRWPARCASARAASGPPSRACWSSAEVEVEVERRARATSRAAASSWSARWRASASRRRPAAASTSGASTGGFTDCLLAGRRGARGRRSTSPTASSHWRLRAGSARDRARARERRALEPAQLPYAPDLIMVDVSFIGLAKVLPALAALRGRRVRPARAGEAAVRAGPRAGRQGRRGARSPDDRLEALVRVGRGGARRSGSRCMATAARACPGPAGNRESFIWCTEARAAGRRRTCARRRWRRSRTAARSASWHRGAPSSAAVGHDARSATAAVLHALTARDETASSCASTLRATTAKHGLASSSLLRVRSDADRAGADVCIVLGGDGATLRALRAHAGTDVPVFAINFGRDRLPRDRRPRRAAARRSSARSPAASRCCSCRRWCSTAARPTCSRSTRSRSSAART